MPATTSRLPVSVSSMWNFNMALQHARTSSESIVHLFIQCFSASQRLHLHFRTGMSTGHLHPSSHDCSQRRSSLLFGQASRLHIPYLPLNPSALHKALTQPFLENIMPRYSAVLALCFCSVLVYLLIFRSGAVLPAPCTPRRRASSLHIAVCLPARSVFHFDGSLCLLCWP